MRALATSLLLAVCVFSTAATGQRALPRDIVWIPAGRFTRGIPEHTLPALVEACNRQAPLLDRPFCPIERFLAEAPQEEIFVRGFAIDRDEVSRARYDRCVDAGRCPVSATSPSDARVGRPEHPASGINHRAAEAYCAFVGGRLPTEDEWERAARGDHDTRRYPWGDALDARLANHGAGTGRVDGSDGFTYLAPVGSYPGGASPFGLRDMAGNVWEWTSTPHRFDGRTPGHHRGASPSGAYVGRGGSFRSPPFTLRVTHRAGLLEGAESPDIGVRCAYDRPRARRPTR